MEAPIAPGEGILAGTPPPIAPGDGILAGTPPPIAPGDGMRAGGVSIAMGELMTLPVDAILPG